MPLSRYSRDLHRPCASPGRQRHGPVRRYAPANRQPDCARRRNARRRDLPELAPQPGEHVIKKHRYSGFFGTDLDIILREWGIETVIISGTTTENCCLATARDAMFRNYRVVFLSDATATYDYPDCGFGAMPNQQVHHATLVILAASTAHVMPVPDLRARLIKASRQAPEVLRSA